MEGRSAAFIGAMADTGYLKAIAVIHVGGGALLLLGWFVPLGLTLLGPVIVNLILFHVFIVRNGMPVALVVAALALFLLGRYRAKFAGFVNA